MIAAEIVIMKLSECIPIHGAALPSPDSWNPSLADSPLSAEEVLELVELWFETTVADGIVALMLRKGTRFDLVALKFVGAMPTWLLTRSYTTYAERRNVSPGTNGASCLSGGFVWFCIPNTQASLPLY